MLIIINTQPSFQESTLFLFLYVSKFLQWSYPYAYFEFNESEESSSRYSLTEYYAVFEAPCSYPYNHDQ